MTPFSRPNFCSFASSSPVRGTFRRSSQRVPPSPFISRLDVRLVYSNIDCFTTLFLPKLRFSLSFLLQLMFLFFPLRPPLTPLPGRAAPIPLQHRGVRCRIASFSAGPHSFVLVNMTFPLIRIFSHLSALPVCVLMADVFVCFCPPPGCHLRVALWGNVFWTYAEGEERYFLLQRFVSPDPSPSSPLVFFDHTVL